MVTAKRTMLGMAVFLGLTTPIFAQRDIDQGTILTTKGSTGKYQAATSVNFAKSLGLPVDSVSTLGARIEQARMAPDPIALAATATELAALERVAGKTAPLTANQLRDQAVELALVRSSSAELKVVAQLVDDKEAREKLMTLAEKAQAIEKGKAGGERSRGISGSVRIVNSTNDDVVKVWANGRGGFVLGRGQFAVIPVGDSAFNTTILYAIGSDGNEYKKPVESPHQNYVWVIRED